MWFWWISMRRGGTEAAEAAKLHVYHSVSSISNSGHPARRRRTERKSRPCQTSDGIGPMTRIDLAAADAAEKIHTSAPHHRATKRGRAARA